MARTPTEEPECWVGLAMPDRDRTPTALALVSHERLGAITELILDRERDVIASMGDGLVDAMQAAAAFGRSDFETCWSPGAGFCLEGLRVRHPPLLAHGVALTLLQAAARGMSSSWCMRPSHTDRLFANHALLPFCDQLQVEHSQEALVLQLRRRAGDCSLRMPVPRSGELGEMGFESLTTVSHEDATLLVLPVDAVQSLDPSHAVDPVPPNESIEALTGALRLLHELSPRYFQWTGWVMRRVALTQGPPGAMNSSSLEGHHGFCFLSASRTPLHFAEMLVHEASHQYLHLASSLGPIADPFYTQQFFSPFPRKMRGLDRILLAYHAFCNVALFYKDCIDRGACRFDKLEEANLLGDLMRTETILLEQHKHLTPLGRDLFEPLLRERSARCIVSPDS
jgi:hypothetical protein